ncbi:MAG: FKBP-type peptidyl-prolyl cis-trans isomerase, partial [Gemmatimonadaceae bacterium]
AIVAFKYDGYIKDGREFEGGSLLATDSLHLSGLIPGLADTMQGMRVGGRRLMVIPSAYAYGNSKITGATGLVVPPNSTLIFDITLTSFVSAQ